MPDLETPEQFAARIVALVAPVGLLGLFDAIRARDRQVREARDRDWILAMAAALGMGSGHHVPIIPEPEPFRELFAVVRREALAPFAWAIAEAFRCEKDIEIRVGSLTTVVTAADVRRALATKEPDDG